MLRKAILCLIFLHTTMASAFSLHAQNAVVVDDRTGKILLEKNSSSVVPIASLTKLMTAMVVLDSKPNLKEKISIESNDVDTLKHSSSHVPVGTTLPREDVLQLALMSSDNRAASSLARTYPGGVSSFSRAVQEKLKSLGMLNTVIKEPTGLSPQNTSTAVDLVKLAEAASTYPEITDITTDSSDSISIKGHKTIFHNTNRLVGKRGWDILLSKTGFTNEAGSCLIMKIRLARRKATIILLNAKAGSAKFLDARNIRKYLENQ